MRARIALLTILLLSLAAPTHAADEEPPPEPTTGGPVIVIFVDTDEIAELVVTDIELTPQSVSPGDPLRLRAQLAAGTTLDRTVIIVEGVGELDGEVTVGSDGSVDFQFVLPADLAPGDYSLSLSSPQLGSAPLGIVTVAPAAPPADEDVATTAAPSSTAATTTTQPAPIGEAAPPVEPGDGGSLALPLGIGAAVLALVMLFVVRRRRPAIGAVEGSAPLPAASAPPDRKPAAKPQPAAADATTVYQVVELTASTDAAEMAAERVLDTFTDLEAAKAAARRAREAVEDEAVERWWEIRPAGKGPVWMMHAWALREYDIDAGTGEDSSSSR